MKKIYITLCLAVAMMFVAAPAVQAETYLFTSDHMTGGAGTGPFGEVALTQNGSQVDFLVTLYGGSRFIVSGAGDFMNFKFNGTDVVLGDIITGPSLTTATGTFDGDGGGLFKFGVHFTGQNNGGGAGIAGPISFTVLNASIADLIAANSPQNHIFVADIISDQTRNTGLVGVELPSQVPEPMTLLLLGLGLVGVAGARRILKK